MVRENSRRKNDRELIWIIGTIMIIIIFILFLIAAMKLQNFSKPNSNLDYSYVSIKDLKQNPMNYTGKDISVKGMLSNRINGYSLKDSEGYWIFIEENCLEPKRQYNYDSGIYTAKGFFLQPNSCTGFCDKVEYNYRLSCVTVLD